MSVQAGPQTPPTPTPTPLTRYTGRFAPSPTGTLHAGSLVAALASWLDARAHGTGRGGRWLVRIEDVDTPRSVPGAAEIILQQLATCGLIPDEPPVWQSRRGDRYAAALQQLIAQGSAYPCGCSRKDIEAAHAARGHGRERHATLPYPGTCRPGLGDKPARAWRFNTLDVLSALRASAAPAQPHGEPNLDPEHMEKAQSAPFFITKNTVSWHDRRLGPQHQDVVAAVGDFVLRRADGLWAYQLAVVVDDADQGITHVVRGEDLADNTPRQMLLQRALGLPAPQYLHTPLICAVNGEKLSKQNGAAPVDLREPTRALAQAAQALGLPALEDPRHTPVAEALAWWTRTWGRIYNRAS